MRLPWLPLLESDEDSEECQKFEKSLLDPVRETRVLSKIGLFVRCQDPAARKQLLLPRGPQDVPDLHSIHRCGPPIY